MASRKTRKKNAVVEDLVRRMNAAEGQSDKRYRVVLRGSAIGGTQRQRATLKCLGLHGRGSQALVEDTPQARGRICAVAHLVAVEDA
jgi:large subunit ribosomal protein L30